MVTVRRTVIVTGALSCVWPAARDRATKAVVSPGCRLHLTRPVASSIVVPMTCVLERPVEASRSLTAPGAPRTSRTTVPPTSIVCADAVSCGRTGAGAGVAAGTGDAVAVGAAVCASGGGSGQQGGGDRGCGEQAPCAGGDGGQGASSGRRARGQLSGIGWRGRRCGRASRGWQVLGRALAADVRDEQRQEVPVKVGPRGA